MITNKLRDIFETPWLTFNDMKRTQANELLDQQLKNEDNKNVEEPN